MMLDVDNEGSRRSIDYMLLCVFRGQRCLRGCTEVMTLLGSLMVANDDLTTRQV